MNKSFTFAIIFSSFVSATAMAAAPTGWSEFATIDAMNVNQSGFTIVPSEPSTTFSNTSCTASTVHVYIGHQGLSQDAVNRMYTIAVDAYMNGKSIAANYDVENGYCYAKQLRIKSDNLWP